MAIPTCHLARSKYIYKSDNQTEYLASFESALIAGTNTSISAADPAATQKRLPKNIKPRFAYIHTTNGTDSANRKHTYTRKVPCAYQDTGDGAPMAEGTVINNFEGCNWVVGAYVGEELRKH